ncbi:hypothetical protein [Thiohalocapsa halophila]|uniref:hypothetical protein n=1 Tax=Thiohalocapsa halophila TaxID=69359 RepID=UPI0019074123|nr:hypothetical protein [Thiohalocapsa halophila]
MDPGADPRFTLEGGGFARLSDDDNYSDIVLYQGLTLAASAVSLSFDYVWSLTAGDPANPDFVQATLWLADFSDLIDLFPAALDTSAATSAGTASTDISAFAGTDVLLEFFLQDGDGTRADWLQVGNISVAEAPLPSPAALVLLGLVPLIGRSLRGGSMPGSPGIGWRFSSILGQRRFRRI